MHRRNPIPIPIPLSALFLALAACGGAEPIAGRHQAVEATLAPIEVLDWIAANQVPLATADPTGDVADLRPLAATIGDARVVALGEATHGTREFFQLKHRMLDYLVAEKGFTVFAFEAGFPEGRDIDDYVIDGDGDAARAVAGLGYWPWSTEEVVDLVEWMRAWNSDPSHTRKVHFVGIDMQVPDRAVRDVLAWLAHVDPPQATHFSTALRLATSRFDYFTLNPSQLATLQADAQALLQLLDDRRAAYEARTSPAAWTLHRQLARVAFQAISLTLIDYTGEEAESLNFRDAAMADNTQWILEQGGPDTKIVLWAHNQHVSKGHFYSGFVNLGTHLAARLGPDLRVFGFAFDAGQFQAIGSDFRLRVFDVASGGPTTLDGTLAAAATPLAVLPLGGLPASGPVADWFASRPTTRDITAGYLDAIPEAYFYDNPVTSYFDALIFVAQTTTARPLPYVRDQITPQPTLPAAANLDLESETDGRPDGWFIPAANEVSGYRIESSHLWPYQGKRSAAIVRDGTRTYGRNYGELRQRISAIPYRGRRVRLHAAIRALVGNAGRAHLWMRVGSQYDGMHDRPIVHPSWRPYDIVLNVPSNATVINFGLVLVGDGLAAIDEVSLTVEPQ
jgi:erythromycin esterase